MLLDQPPNLRTPNCLASNRPWPDVMNPERFETLIGYRKPWYSRICASLAIWASECLFMFFGCGLNSLIETSFEYWQWIFISITLLKRSKKAICFSFWHVAISDGCLSEGYTRGYYVTHPALWCGAMRTLRVPRNFKTLRDFRVGPLLASDT